MARRLAFDPVAWEHYHWWQLQDGRMLARINELIRAILRDPFAGIGKPEPLRGALSGLWSRRIDQTHRLVYRVRTGDVEIVSCRYHYGDR
ncbi:MAG TPA: Txe/YoeB family addiction module toxin [Rhodanobacteraceae bacterium]